VRVFQPVARADLRILVGSVLPHLQAGFGAGYKLIFPGTSHRTTLGSLHRLGLVGRSDPISLLGSSAADNPMRRVIHDAAKWLGLCWSISHPAGGPARVFQIAAGHPERVQDILAKEARRRLQVPEALPADLIVAGNNLWPGDPMQSFIVLLHHRSASWPGGVLVGLFWTDPDEIDRSFPIKMLRSIAATGEWGGCMIRRWLPLAGHIAGAVGLPAAFMMHWARELIVDRMVMVYAPPLRDRIGPQLGPVQLVADQSSLWQAAAAVTEPRSHTKTGEPMRIRVFPQGGLTYVASSGGPVH
jgi:hypothetical protein